MPQASHRVDADGYYLDRPELDRTPVKIYAVLYKPASGALAITHWERGTLFGMTEEWWEIFENPAEQAFWAERGIRFRYAEQMEQYLDDGHVLETRRCWYRRDKDAGNNMCPKPEGWTGPWEERI